MQSNRKVATLTIAVLLIASFALTTIPALAQIGANGGSPNNAPNGSIPLPAGGTADAIVKSDIYLSFRPKPVGIGQPILVNVWLDPRPSYVRHFNGYKITF
jgi:hypothetical protein